MLEGQLSPPAAPPRLGRLLRHRDFRLFWFGETTSGVGSAMTVVAMPLVGLLVLHLSTFAIGLLSAMAWFPWLLVGLPAGAWVDRLAKRPVMLICDAVSFAAFVSVPVAAWLGILTATQLFGVALVTGVAGVFFTTAYNAYLPVLVDDDRDLQEANAKLQGSASAARIIGPGLAGLVAQTLGVVTGLFGDALSFAVSALCLARLRRSEPRRPERPGDGTSLGRQIREGVRFIVHDPYLRVLTLYAGVANFGEAVMESVQMVFFVRTVGLSSGAAGSVVAVMSLGGVLGSMLSTRVSRRFGTARGMLLCQAVATPFALLVPLTTSSARVPLCLVGGTVYLAGVIAANIMIAGFEQAYVPEHMRGRIGATASLVAYGAIPLGALVGGGIGDAFGPRAAIWTSVLITTLSIGFLFIGPIRKQRDLPSVPVLATA